MAEWKKIVVSGSDISQLNNDSGYLTSGGTIDSASVAARATTLSADATASFADLASVARTANSASVAARATELSADATASFALVAGTSRNADSASVAARATTLSPEATASIADRATSASIADALSQLATASHALTAVTASHALNVPDTASFALNAQSSSVAARATTLSADATASFADLASDARTADSASVAARATTLSADATASFALVAGTARSADSASVAARATTLSADATASFADLASTVHDGNITTAKIADGDVTNAKLENDSITFGTTAQALGSTVTSISGLTSISATTGSFVLQVFESSSTIITSGSNIFGDKQDDIQQFTGSIQQTGSFTLSGSLLQSNGVISGTFQGDGSGLTGLATNLTVDGDTGTQDVSLVNDDLQILGTTDEITTAVTKVGNDVKVTLGLPDTIEVTSSVATRANTLSPLATASFADLASSARSADSASVAARATTLSADATASFALVAGTSRNSDSASVAARATTLSPEATASIADFATALSQDATASFALIAGTSRNADSSSVAARATTLSADATASFADLASDARTATSASIAQTATSASATVAGVLFPTADGLVNQALVTDGAGQFTYGDVFGTGSTKKLNQSSAAVTWSFAHNLNEIYPIVQVYDSTGDQIIPERVESIDVNNVKLYFSEATAGVAAAMVGGMGISASNATRATSASIADEASTLSSTATASFADLASDARTADSASVAARATTLSSDATASYALLASDARTATTASHALSGAGDFSGSFEGDGSGLTGIASSLAVSSSNDLTGDTINLKTEVLSFAGATNQVSISVDPGNNTVNVGLAHNVTVPNNLTVTGDLTVNGTTTTVNTQNLFVEDKFILLNSGSANPDEAGIVVDEGNGFGHAYVYDSDGARFGFTGSLDATATSVTPDAFAAAVVDEAAGHSDVAEYQKPGNIRVASNGDIFIYS